METFGVHFRVDREDLFPFLISLFDALKAAKDTGTFPETEEWLPLLHPDATVHFYWPSEGEQIESVELQTNLPIHITEPSDALGAEWDFDSFLDAVQNGEYALLGIVRNPDRSGELQINPFAYPYGGISAFIALVEAHGMYVLGINEYGEYQSRAELAP